MNLRMFWKDTRLSMLSSGAGDDSFVVLNPNLLQRIWHPDVFIGKTNATNTLHLMIVENLINLIKCHA